ncbi:pectinesterase 1-like [Salvia hispanica]|uniref:pectinesterase 1-like n=1 Tax=Salvia hispanica TaxID=49212 RepID=UPI002009C504|nr:pectinesterase 1-like [Salvia hispanica]
MKMSFIVVVVILFSLPIIVRSNDAIPADKAQLGSWFDKHLAVKKPAAVGGGGPPKVIRVGGGGQFRTVTEAINSIPVGNAHRVVVSIAPGNYTEKITIPKEKPFVTLYGDPKNMPVLVFAGTAAKYGTVECATLTAESDHFMGVNLKVVNSAPRPDGKMVGAQAAAVRVGGDASVFYNCKFYGYQDTVFDYKGRHLFKDCYIEGTVDFIFGSARSLYLNCEIHVIPGDGNAIITAHARNDAKEETGFSFVHCSITGTAPNAVLGRSWFPYPRVVFALCDISSVIIPEGWSNNFHPETNSTVYFGEFNNRGPGANMEKRVTFAKKLTPAEANPFITLAYIEASTWLLPAAGI